MTGSRDISLPSTLWYITAQLSSRICGFASWVFIALCARFLLKTTPSTIQLSDLAPPLTFFSCTYLQTELRLSLKLYKTWGRTATVIWKHAYTVKDLIMALDIFKRHSYSHRHLLGVEFSPPDLLSSSFCHKGFLSKVVISLTFFLKVVFFPDDFLRVIFLPWVILKLYYLLLIYQVTCDPTRVTKS